MLFNSPMIIKLICYLNSNQKQVNPHFLSTVNKREKLGFFEKTVTVSYFPVSFSFLQQKKPKKTPNPITSENLYHGFLSQPLLWKQLIAKRIIFSLSVSTGTLSVESELHLCHMYLLWAVKVLCYTGMSFWLDTEVLDYIKSLSAACSFMKYRPNILANFTYKCVNQCSSAMLAVFLTSFCLLGISSQQILVSRSV